MNSGQDIEIHFMPPQELSRPHYLIECRFAGFIHPVGIMKLPRSIQAQADEEVVRMEEFAPFVIKESAIGLHGILEGHFLAFMLLLILD